MKGNSNYILRSIFKACRRGFIYALALLSIGFYCLSCRPSARDSNRLSDSVNAKVVEPVYFDLEQMQERGSIRALVDNSSTSYFTYKGRLMGYEYELLKRLAKNLDLELEIVVVKSIDDAFDKLNSGEGDVVAFPLTITKERKRYIAFTDRLHTSRQVLVQRKPEGWRKMGRRARDRRMIRDQVELIGQEVHVRKSSSYVDRLENLAEEIGGDIVIVEDEKDVETEFMIKKVLNGEIDYTVADEEIAKVNATYYPDIDVQTPISFPQQIAWALRKNAPEFKDAVNAWLSEIKSKATFNIIYNKYFDSPRASVARAKSDFSSIEGGKLSQYDDLIKVAADTLGWDWRLLASQIYQESRFNPQGKSWAGASGLMQLMPATGKRFGVTNFSDPKQSIKAGTKYIQYLNKMWKTRIDDQEERIKFILASYNVGPGHVIDAFHLAHKYGKDSTQWFDHVEFYLQNKSRPEFYNDPVVRSGYCRGDEPVNYVRQILARYESYKQLIAGES
ncbi:MAG: transporter substrate-binding domain-containing protein [Bacteroidota bacterium]